MKPAIEGEGENLSLIESLYDQFQKDPSQLDLNWQRYFQSLDSSASSSDPIIYKNDSACKIEQLIRAYRRDGHLVAQTDSLSEGYSAPISSLNYETYGFTSADLSTIFSTEGILPEKTAPLSKILETLQRTYCGLIGFEYEGIVPVELETWLKKRIEQEFYLEQLNREQKMLIMETLNRSELLETFLHTKFVGQKRFSLEGAETLIPMLALLLEKAGEIGVEEVIIGMSHRGRLNVLSNILNKSYTALLEEFKDNHLSDSVEGMGDVKYHKGHIGDYLRRSADHKIKLTLCPNPSHLESVDAVVEGTTRAKQFLNKDEDERVRIIPLLIHGDAAISGQGVVYETLQLSQLEGYKTGGTIHYVINNHIGFTTLPRDMRSTFYCTDIAKSFNLPIFHVNAEDPESCVKISLLALEIRQKFHCDVFIELNCYRKYGHNEGDEPAYTQPVRYKAIRNKKPIRILYRDHLLENKMVSKVDVDKLEVDFKKGLQDAHEESGNSPPSTNGAKQSAANESFTVVFTGVSYDTLLYSAKRLSEGPDGFHIHPKIKSLVQQHLKAIEEKKNVDWSLAETLAYATLLLEGTPVRISGQDCARGTFSHRHALWVDQDNSMEYFPLAHLKPDQARFEVINSPLSEMAVLGFEYGYNVAFSKSLTVWEAQFGDFSNGAQIIIDQYIVSGEQKWGQKSSLVLFLPHGYEGQGPEHSSGRLERFLSLAGHDNMEIVYPTTPAQIFHLLRRQKHQQALKPLIVFTPKGLLRLPACVSPVEELVDGHFQDIIDDPLNLPDRRRLVFCSGRVYYDLLENRNDETVALVRIERLYPLNIEKLKSLIAKYQTEDYVWAQEEHKNMGAWSYIHSLIQELLPANKKLKYAGRQISASPATGIHTRHEQEKATLFKQVFE